MCYWNEENFFEPGEFDEKIEELKNELRESVKKERRVRQSNAGCGKQSQAGQTERVNGTFQGYSLGGKLGLSV